MRLQFVKCFSVVACVTAVLFCCAPGLSKAQAAAAASVTPGAGDQIQEVIVTAQRREESVQTVPIAISVITGDSALQSGITSSQDLPLAVPGLQMDLNGIGVAPFLRGVGSTFAAAGAEPPVALYIDGEYIPSSAGALFNLNNVDRVEVLKGPQGTLFGRNATGGVIQVITKEPSSDPSADLSVGYGNYDTSTLSFYGTTGLAAGLATDLAVYADDNPNGWGHNLLNGDRAYQYEDIDVRNTWVWRPQESTQIKLALDYEDTTNEAGLGGSHCPARSR